MKEDIILDKELSMKDVISENIPEILSYIFNPKEWGIFFKRFLLIFALFISGYIFWLFPVSLAVAPFYSVTTSTLEPIKKESKLEGKSTVLSVRNGMQDLLNKGLVTNFIGVRNWIDNKPNEQIGEIEIYRIAVNTLENNLGRNRGTGGANKHLVQARADIYADYERPYFTSYSTRLKQSINSIDKYLEELEKNKNVEMSKKTAVFIVNSDNLAEVLDKVKQQIQTNLARPITFLTEDDKFYKIRGNLIATYYFLKGIDFDFKDKMIDKSSYTENFIPILESLENAISRNPLIVLEFKGDVSKIEKDANVVSQKLAELRDKLKNG